MRSFCASPLFQLVSWSLLLTVAVRAEDHAVRVVSVSHGFDGFTLVAKLRNCTEATITLTADPGDYSASVPLPLTVDAAGRTEFPLVTFSPAKRFPFKRVRWEYHWRYGRRVDREPESFIYELPYRGEPRPGVGGRLAPYSHGPGSGDEEAADFEMPVGTPVCPARAGTVVALREDSRRGGPDPRLRGHANYVVIRHDDGTFAEYVHLKRRGVLVHLGEHVGLDKPIALSGLTGFTNKPHLHFSVFYNVDGHTRTSLPLVFRFPPRAGAVSRAEYVRPRLLTQ